MKRPFLLLLTLVILYGCKKTNSSSGNTTTPPINDQPPAVTDIGTPVGKAVVKTMGAGGGTLMSSDGKIQLTIPLNALATNTDISIQPVSNKTPGGIGLSYHLMPDGTKFNIPVTLTFNYADSDVSGTLPYLLFIAYQDSARIWQASLKKRSIDTIAKTVTLDISHFSIWTLGEELKIFSDPNELQAKGTSSVLVYLCRGGDSKSYGSNGDDDIAPLPPTIPIPDNAVSQWKVNGQLGGNAQNGVISGTGSTATYSAPESIDEETIVQVSAQLNYTLSLWNNGNLVSSLNEVILYSPIILLPDKYRFSVHVVYTVIGESISLMDIYQDSAAFEVDVDVAKDLITIPPASILNYPPSEKPNHVVSGSLSAVWTPDQIGLTNVVGIQTVAGFENASVYPTPNSNTLTVELYLDHLNTETPIWIITDNTTHTSSQSGPYPDVGEPQEIQFPLIRSPQHIDLNNDGSVILTVTNIP